MKAAARCVGLAICVRVLGRTAPSAAVTSGPRWLLASSFIEIGFVWLALSGQVEESLDQKQIDHIYERMVLMLNLPPSIPRHSRQVRKTVTATSTTNANGSLGA